MKTKSVILVVVAAVVGFAFVTPDADALPRWKSPGGPAFGKKQVERKANVCCAATKTSATDAKKKTTIGLAVRKDTKMLRPYFERRSGGPAYRRGR